jgi:hypothetical protein
MLHISALRLTKNTCLAIVVSNMCYVCNIGDSKISFMSDPTLALEKIILSRGGNLHKDEKRDKVIRVRQWTYEKLGELGSSKNDFDDVIFTLIEFWEKHHKRK